MKPRRQSMIITGAGILATARGWCIFDSQFDAEETNLPLVNHVASIGLGQDFEVVTSNWAIQSDDTIRVQMRFRHTNERGRNEVLCLAKVNAQGQVVEFRFLSPRPVR